MIFTANNLVTDVAEARRMSVGYKEPEDAHKDAVHLLHVRTLIHYAALNGEQGVRVPKNWVSKQVETDLLTAGFLVGPEMNTNDVTLGIRWDMWHNPIEQIQVRLQTVRADLWRILSLEERNIVETLLLASPDEMLKQLASCYTLLKTYDEGMVYWQFPIYTNTLNLHNQVRQSACGWANMAVRGAICNEDLPDEIVFSKAVQEAKTRYKIAEKLQELAAQEPPAQEQCVLLGHKGEVVGSCGPTLVDTGAMMEDLKEQGTLALPAQESQP
jgi:hypothetical protein